MLVASEISPKKTHLRHSSSFLTDHFLHAQVQDAFRCRLRNCQDPISGDATGTFPNGHAQIMVGCTVICCHASFYNLSEHNVPRLFMIQIHTPAAST